ncbi:MAG: hypothetical protein RL238_50, partial [Actinomycetota bacterium]
MFLAKESGSVRLHRATMGSVTDDITIPGPRVLVVEDDQVQAFLVREALAGSGFSDVRIAATAHEADVVLATWTPDLLILDLGLPDGDGLS